MGFFDDARVALDKGATTVAGAMSGVAVEQQTFMRGFVRLCEDGWNQGWHERNGGNVSYRLTEEEVRSCAPFFAEGGAWNPLEVEVANLGGAYFAVTGAGRYLRNVALDPDYNVGIVQVGADGKSWRLVWGLKDGKPTSELSSHLLIHSIRVAATQGACRVLYHAHPDNIIALSKVVPLDARVITRLLWKATTESIIAFPKGIGVVDWMVPGGPEIAEETGRQMETFDAVIWAQHGLFASGSDFDAAFGLMHTADKAARVYALARMMNGGSDDFPNTIPDEGLREIARRYDLDINEEFLD